MFLHDFIMVYKYTSNTEATALITSEMMKELTNMFHGKTNNNTFKSNLVLWSAHDITVVSMLAALGMISTNCFERKYFNQLNNNEICVDYPHFSAALMFELYSTTNNN